MGFKYFISFLCGLCFFALQCATAQSYINIISSDSTQQWTLKVNDELVTDSINLEINLSFPFQEKVFLELLDSTKQTVLQKTLTLQPDFITDYSLLKADDQVSLKLLAQSSLEPNSVTNLSESESINLEPGLEINSELIIIDSEYFNPNEKQQVFVNSIDDYRFEQEKVKAVKEFLQSQKPSNNLINKALLKISYEDKRAEVILDLKEELKGKISKNDLNTLFKLSRYKTAVATALEIN
jgi:hypothetical protein